jgi:hypothetical protein
LLLEAFVYSSPHFVHELISMARLAGDVTEETKSADASAQADHNVDAIYYRDAGGLLGARDISARARATMYSLFVGEMQPTSATTILDWGVSDEEGPETNMLEKLYPWRERITCAGLGEGIELRRSYPDVSYVKIAANEPLPFGDKSFDIVWSNAVALRNVPRSSRKRRAWRMGSSSQFPIDGSRSSITPEFRSSIGVPFSFEKY